MSLYEKEHEQALEALDALGKARGDYDFAMDYLPPDPDGAGMFTVEYEVRVSANGRTLKLIGGIGSNWVGRFRDAVEEGYFD